MLKPYQEIEQIVLKELYPEGASIDVEELMVVKKAIELSHDETILDIIKDIQKDQHNH